MVQDWASIIDDRLHLHGTIMVVSSIDSGMGSLNVIGKALNSSGRFMVMPGSLALLHLLNLKATL